jgi:hypothetical protein
MRYAANGWGIQKLKNGVIEPKPILKRDGLSCFGPHEFHESRLRALPSP